LNVFGIRKDVLLLRQKSFEAKNSRHRQILFWLIPLIIFAKCSLPFGAKGYGCFAFVHFKAHKSIQPFLFCLKKSFLLKIPKTKIKNKEIL